MVEHETAAPRAKAPKVRRQTKLQVAVMPPATREQELEQLKQYARKMSKSSKEEAIAFLKRAGILDSRGNMDKAYRS